MLARRDEAVRRRLGAAFRARGRLRDRGDLSRRDTADGEGEVALIAAEFGNPIAQGGHEKKHTTMVDMSANSQSPSGSECRSEPEPTGIAGQTRVIIFIKIFVAEFKRPLAEIHARMGSAHKIYKAPV